MIYESALISVFFQIATAVVDVYGLQLPVDDNFTILKDILTVELGVQLVELIFYIWLILSINSYKNITIYRYIDWFITTPVMLISLMAYLDIDKSSAVRLGTFLKRDSTQIAVVVLLNILMLGCGLLSELFPSKQLLWVFIGFIPFVAYFYYIWKEYLKKDKKDVHPVFTRNRIFWYFVGIWSLYGVAAFLPYVQKNTALNILDLFSKNAFGVVLVVILMHHSLKTNVLDQRTLKMGSWTRKAGP